MSIQFKESHKYLIEQSIFNRSILTCHCVQDGWAYLSASPSYAYLSDTPSSQAYTEKVEYKYNIKRERMYVYNKAFSSWDRVEAYTITEYGSNTVYEPLTVI